MPDHEDGPEPGDQPYLGDQPYQEEQTIPIGPEHLPPDLVPARQEPPPWPGLSPTALAIIAIGSLVLTCAWIAGCLLLRGQ